MTCARKISYFKNFKSHISRVHLFSSQVLAKKVHTLYSLAVQQLSKQDHYDFGLRGLTSLLRYAGKKKRANPTFSDEEVVYLFDSNVFPGIILVQPMFQRHSAGRFPSKVVITQNGFHVVCFG